MTRPAPWLASPPKQAKPVELIEPTEQERRNGWDAE